MLRKLAAAVVVLLATAGCVTPYDRYVHPHPTTSLYDWKCTITDAHGPTTVFWTTDKGVRALVDVVTDTDVVCEWVTAAQNCAGAPADLYRQCLRSGEPK